MAQLAERAFLHGVVAWGTSTDVGHVMLSKTKRGQIYRKALFSLRRNGQCISEEQYRQERVQDHMRVLGRGSRAASEPGTAPVFVMSNQSRFGGFQIHSRLDVHPEGDAP